MFFKYHFGDLYYSHKVDDPAMHSSTDGKDPAVQSMLMDHYHTVYEVDYFISGNAEYFIEDRRYPLKSGDIIIIKPGQHHNAHILGPERYERYVLRFTEYLIPSDILSRFSRFSGCYYVGDTLIPNLFSRLDYHIENVGDDPETLKMLFRCVLCEIIVYMACLGSRERKGISLLPDDMRAVLDYINKNIERPLCLEDLCREFHYSKSHLCHRFSISMGVPIIQYVRTKRIMYADRLMKDGMRPTEAALRCGYSDYSTFYRLYKKIIGKPPSSKH